MTAAERDAGPPRYLHPPQYCYGGRVGGYSPSEIPYREITR